MINLASEYREPLNTVEPPNTGMCWETRKSSGILRGTRYSEVRFTLFNTSWDRNLAPVIFRFLVLELDCLLTRYW